MGEVVKAASRIFMGLLSSAAERFKLVKTITAGWDSRLLLAASPARIASDLLHDGPAVGHAREPCGYPDIVFPLSPLGPDHRIVRSNLILDPEFVKTYKTNAVLAHNHYLPDAQAILNSDGLSKGCVVGAVSGLVQDLTLGSTISINSGTTPAEMSTELYGLGRNQYALTEIGKWFAGIGQIHHLSRDTIGYWEQRAANWLAMNQVEFDIAWRDIFVPYNCRGLLMAMLAAREGSSVAAEQVVPGTYTEPMARKC